ncbi:MAG: hypothetical protein CMJ80_04345 [Planctomycetaceae bacterium]|nr:hypothetical protein [Planctomycetaceae bacterium]
MSGQNSDQTWVRCDHRMLGDHRRGRFNWICRTNFSKDVLNRLRWSKRCTVVSTSADVSAVVNGSGAPRHEEETAGAFGTQHGRRSVGGRPTRGLSEIQCGVTSERLSSRFAGRNTESLEDGNAKSFG